MNTLQSLYLETKETERLMIVPLNSDHIDPWKSFLSDPSSTRYFPDHFSQDPLAAEKWIQSQLVRYAESRFGLMALYEKDNGAFVGQCGLITQEVDQKTELEIGYHLLKDYRGNGYATEASQFFKYYAAEQTPFDSVISLIHPENQNSQAVARRNGMHNSSLSSHHDMPCIVFRINI